MGVSAADDNPLIVDESVMPHAQNESNAEEPLPSSRFSYVKSGDFIELICCAIFTIVACTCLAGTSPRERPIPFQVLDNSGDRVLNLSFAEALEENETISGGLLIAVAVVIPLILQMILTKVLYVKGDAHATLCVYLVALGIDVFLLEFVKNYVGYLRPHFYAACQPNESFDECTDDSEESRKSFPSGHASLTFCGMTLFSLYLLRRFGCNGSSSLLSAEERQEDGKQVVVLKYRKPPRYKHAISILCVSPMLLAVFVAASRVVDNYHFPADVVGGSAIGFGIAMFTNGLWFPSWSLLL